MRVDRSGALASPRVDPWGGSSAAERRAEKIVAFGARGSSAKVPGRIRRMMRDVLLRLVFRFVVTERSMAWQFGHRVEWDRRMAVGSTA